MPDLGEYPNLLSRPDAPTKIFVYGHRPLYFTLKEHFCYSPSLPIPLDSDENGLLNAWLPADTLWVEKEVRRLSPKINLCFIIYSPPRMGSKYLTEREHSNHSMRLVSPIVQATHRQDIEA
jgi:hypothetical protein